MEFIEIEKSQQYWFDEIDIGIKWRGFHVCTVSGFSTIKRHIPNIDFWYNIKYDPKQWFYYLTFKE